MEKHPPPISFPVLLGPCSATSDESKFLNWLKALNSKMIPVLILLANIQAFTPSEPAAFPLQFYLARGRGIDEELELRVQMSKVQSIHN